MSNNMFGGVDLLQKGLDAAWLRNDVITNNIANADTPNYKSAGVQFESLFKAALVQEQTPADANKRTREGHIVFSDGEEQGAQNAQSAQDVSPLIVRNEEASLRPDGNSVDIEAENVALARNTIYYYALTQQISSEFTRLGMAIREGK